MQNGLFKNDVKADEGKEFISEQNEREWVEFFKSCRMYFAYKIRQKRGYEGGFSTVHRVIGGRSFLDERGIHFGDYAWQ